MIYRILFAIAATAFLSEVSVAAYTLRFSTSAPVNVGVASFTVGSSNVIQLYLDDSVATGDLSNFGLITANLGDPNIGSFAPGVTRTGAGTITAATPSASFSDSSTIGAVNGSGTEAAWTASVGFGTPVFGTTSAFGYSVLLGTFTVDAGNVEGANGSLSVTPTSLGDFALDGYNLTTENDLAGLGGNFSFTVTAVPEPTSIVGGSLLGVLGLWVARRKRLAKANAIKK